MFGNEQKFSRSEEDQIAKAAIRLRFGDKDYDVKPLTIGKARTWRDALVTEMRSITSLLRGDADNASAFVGAMGMVFLAFPEKMAELVFAYAPDLPREEILEQATDEQMAAAFSRIMRVAFPFAQALGLATTMLTAAASSPASEPSTSSR